MAGFGAIGDYAIGDTPAAGAIIVIPVAAVVAALVAPTVLGGARVTPPSGGVDVATVAPQIGGGWRVVMSDAIAAESLAPSPEVAGGGGPSLLISITATFTYAPPAIRGGARVVGVPMGIVAAGQSPNIRGGARVVGVPVNAIADTPPPHVAGGARVRAGTETIQIVPSGGVGVGAIGDHSIGGGPRVTIVSYEPMRMHAQLKAPQIAGGGGVNAPSVDEDVTFRKPSISARPRRVRITTIASTEI